LKTNIASYEREGAIAEPNKQLCGLPIGHIVSLGNAELKGVKLEEEQVVGFSFKNERCFLADVPGVNSSSARCSHFMSATL